MATRTVPTLDADAAIDLMGRAAEANLSDAYRTGTLIELPLTGDVLIAGDLHGNMANYRELVAVADLAVHRDRHLILQELTHDSFQRLPDRCASLELVEAAAELKTQFPDRVHILLGNHELAELVGIPIVSSGRMVNAYFQLGIQMAYGERRDDVRRAYKGFFRSVPLAAQTSTGVFISHSSPERTKLNGMDRSFFLRPVHDDDYAKDGAAHNLVWGRDLSQAAADAFANRVGAQVLIVGHQPCPRGIDAPNTRHIVLDSAHDRGRYLLLPLDQPLSQEEILARSCRIGST